MGIIKRSSATTLVGWFALLAVLLSAITVTAFAVTRSGPPKPPKRSLASAVHVALSAPPVAGVSAQFAIDQHLLAGGSSTINASPLAGATGSVWVGGGRVRLKIHSQFGITELGFGGHQLMVYDRKHHVAYELPIAAHKGGKSDSAPAHAVPAIAAINGAIGKVKREAVLWGAIPSNVAGRKAYTVRMSPRRDGGLFGAFELAWDAAHQVPLRFAIYPRGSSTAAVEVTVTHIQYGSVPAAKLRLVPPRGTKIVHVHMPNRNRLQSEASRAHPAVGAAAVARAVGFRLAAPVTLAGLHQSEVRSVDVGKSPAALVTYGRGLGTLFVLEQRATGGQSPLGSLPSASIAGTKGHELETTLGTLVQFTRGGVTYTVVGSRPAVTIMTAAKELG